MMASQKQGKPGGIAGLMSNVQRGIQKKQEEMRIASEAKREGKIWDTKKKEWIFYILDEEYNEIQQEAMKNDTSFDDAGATTPTNQADERKVADREYYDLLKVSTNADSSTIKKAYYKEARRCHPDKNPDDPEAHEKFQKIGHAYQVLSDEARRANYDKNGIQETNSDAINEVDPFVFFNVMFGSALVEPYVGELWLATQTDTIMGNQDLMQGIDENLSEEEKNKIFHEKMDEMKLKNEFKQRQRYIKCAMNIRERVKNYEYDPVGFTEGCKEEAVKIADGAYGGLYCVTIGFAMQVAAEEYLGFENSFLGLGGHVARTQKGLSGLGASMKLLGAGIKAASAGMGAMVKAEELKQKAAEQGQEIGEVEAQQVMGSLSDSLPTFLELAWAVNKTDIQKTLEHACKKLLISADVPRAVRIRRAEALKILGRELLTAGKKASVKKEDAEDIKARVAVATMTTMAKAQGQEVNEEDHEEMIEQARVQMQMQKMDEKDGGLFEENGEVPKADATQKDNTAK